MSYHRREVSPPEAGERPARRTPALQTWQAAPRLTAQAA